MELESNLSDSQSFGALSREIYYADKLMDEILAENLTEVKRLLEVQKASPNVVVPERGVAGLHLLAGLENEDFSRVVTLMALLTGDGDPNVRSEEGLTPVHVAAMWGRSSVLEVLLSNGGDPTLLDYRMRLSAEDYALREQQWHAFGILTTFSVITEDEDRFAKYLEDEISSEGRTTIKNLKNIKNFKESTVGGDYDWISKTKQVIPLDKKAIDMIKNHRRKTKLYEHPGEDYFETRTSDCPPKLPERNKKIPSEWKSRSRNHKKKQESEVYFCGFAESSYNSKSEFVRKDKTSNEVSSSDFGSDKASSNTMLCKMSRIFLFMLKKRHIYQRIK
uniref:Uncharacterized protein n=1 Tax=Cuerna arida TaxID=1464854 RepID=A0A1B6GV76_9HEMI